LEISVPI